MLTPVFAGQRATAALIASLGPLAAVKSADQSVTSSTTQVNDNALLLSVVASARYLFVCYLDYEGGTQGSSDIIWSWTLPGGATLRYAAMYKDTSGNSQSGDTKTASTNVAAGTNGAAFLRGAWMVGTLFCGASAGTIQLMWAQNTSNGTPTIVHAQSVLALWRLS